MLEAAKYSLIYLLWLILVIGAPMIFVENKLSIIEKVLCNNRRLFSSVAIL